MEEIRVKAKNQTYLQLDADMGIIYEIKEHFTFFVDGYKHMPKFKMRVWDGTISLLNLQTKTLPRGLYEHLKEFAKAREYTITPLGSNYGLPGETHSILPEDVVDFVKSLNCHSGGTKLEIRDYQYAAIYKALKDKRRTMLSPTSSGKSLIQYCIIRYLIDNDIVENVMMTVPTTALGYQMYKDFEDYSSENGWSVEDNVHIVMAGKEKSSKKRITISTFQSQMKVSKEAMLKYGAIINDEAHGVKSNELQKLLDKCTEAEWRLGFTGTIGDSKTNKLMIEGMLGPVYKVTETKKLIDQGHISDIDIKCITLDYSKTTKALLSKNNDYNKEMDFIVSHDRRNKFLKNLILSLDGNTLVLLNYIEKHGDILDAMIREEVGERKYFYIHGGVDAEDRDLIRPIVESSNNAIILASYGTMSTGVSIKKIDNLILASPTKSVIRVLQSIGRGLRKGNGKTHLNMFDISDDLSNSKVNKNFTYNHYINRLKIYASEQFNYTCSRLDIE